MEGLPVVVINAEAITRFVIDVYALVITGAAVALFLRRRK